MYYRRRRRAEELGAAEILQALPRSGAGLVEEAAPCRHPRNGPGCGGPRCDSGRACPGRGSANVGDYELLEENLAAGGMGVSIVAATRTWAARWPSRVLLDQHGDNEELKRHFLKEAQSWRSSTPPAWRPSRKVGHLPDGRPSSA